MQAEDRTLIRVQREWDGWRTAEVRLSDLQDVHWFQPGGAPRPLVHGYISCGSVVRGDIPHDCDRTPAPHRLLVCVLKKHTAAGAYSEIARRADERTDVPAGTAARAVSAIDWPARASCRTRGCHQWAMEARPYPTDTHRSRAERPQRWLMP
jgi:hypothetical protein